MTMKEFKNPYLLILDFLNKNQINFQEFEHEPVYTTEQAARIRGEAMADGAKSLVVKINNNFVLLVLPGDRRLSSKKVKNLFKISEFRFAKPEEVVSAMGCEIGACFPLGNLVGLKTYVDKSLTENQFINFNPGVHYKTIKMRFSDYQKIAEFEIIDIAE
ncbi:MAG: YbaK/EbsC family protein [Patescibacteria group bacterium]